MLDCITNVQVFMLLDIVYCFERWSSSLFQSHGGLLKVFIVWASQRDILTCMCVWGYNMRNSFCRHFYDLSDKANFSDIPPCNSPQSHVILDKQCLYLSNWLFNRGVVHCCFASVALVEESAPWCLKWLECGVYCTLQHLPSQHFKDEDSQSPPVHRSAVTFALDDFRSQVLRSATQSPGPDQRDRGCWALF